MKCVKCNHLLPDDSLFCQYCGCSLKNAEPVKEPERVPAEEPKLPPDQVTPAAPEKFKDPALEQKFQPYLGVQAVLERSQETPVEEPKPQPYTPPQEAPVKFEEMPVSYREAIGIETPQTAAYENPPLPPSRHPQFGLVPNQPIYVKGSSALNDYLRTLRSTKNEAVVWQGRGSLNVHGISGLIEVFDIFSLSGKYYKTIYINPYGKENSTQAPAGFQLDHSFLAPPPPPPAAAVNPYAAPVRTSKPSAPRKARHIVLPIVLAVLLLVSCALHVVQYKIAQEKSAVYNEIYDEIYDFTKYTHIGYASPTFHTSESIIFVKEHRTNYKFNLTAYWGKKNVTINYSCSTDAADISCDKKTWEQSTLVTVIPKHKGTTVVTFTNTYNSESFKILIVVTD